MEKKQKLFLSKYKTLFLVTLVFVFSISMLGFTAKYLYMTRYDRQIQTLERSLMDLKAAMNIDAIRQFNIEKVMKIIDRQNKSMPSNLKYEIANEIYNMSIKYSNLSVDLISAVISQETGDTWDPGATSKAGALGLMQIMPTTGMFLASYEGINWTTPEDVLYNPISNIRLGCRHLSALIQTYGVEGGIAAYNGGERKAAEWLASNKAKGILYKETANYVPAVLRYNNLYQKSQL